MKAATKEPALEPQWVSYGGSTGWRYQGRLPGKIHLGGGDFFARAGRVLCEVEGSYLDGVQCYDGAVMTAGPIGSNALDGSLARLLCDFPDHTLVTAGITDLLAESGTLIDRIYRAFAECKPRVVEGVSPIVRHPKALSTPRDMRDLFLAGSDGLTWSEEQLDRSYRWIAALGRLLGAPGAWGYVTQHVREQLEGYVGALPVTSILRHREGIRYLETPLLRRSLACWLCFAHNHLNGALKLLGASGPTEEAILQCAARQGAWPSTFADRVEKTRTALAGERWQ